LARGTLKKAGALKGRRYKTYLPSQRLRIG
jgi:hypothetical protein